MFTQPGILRDTVAMFSGQVFVMALGIGQGVVMARCLSLEAMGRFQLVMSYIAVGQLCGLPGMNIVVNKGAMKGYDHIFSRVLRISTQWALTGAVALFATGSVMYWRHWNGDLGRTLMLVSAFLPFHGLEKFDSMLVGKRMFVLSRGLNVVSGVFTLALVGGVAFITRRFVPALAAAFLVRAGSAAVGIYLTRRKMQRVEVDPVLEKEYLAQGWQQTWLTLSGIVVGQLDRIVVGSISPAMLALFYVGAIIPNKVKDNSKILSVIITNHWGRLPKKENLMLIRKYAWMILGGGALLSLGIWIFTPFVLRHLYGEGYRGAATIAKWLSLPLGLGFFTVFVQNVDLFQDRGKFYTRQSYIRQIIYIALLFALVHRYSYWGVVAANVLSEVYTFFSSVFYFRKQLKNA